MDIRDSIDRVSCDAKHEFSSRFYQNLFLHHPNTMSKFEGVDLKRQGVLLIVALETVCRQYTRPSPATQNYLRYLGHKHHLLGITAGDYLHFGTALLSTLGAFHGPEWCSDLAEQWKAAFRQSIDVMLQGHVDDFVFT